MKTIKQLNEDNEKTEVHLRTFHVPEEEWVSFEQVLDLGFVECEKIDSGRGGELLKNRNQFFSSGHYQKVKCSKTGLKGKAYWKHAIRGIIDRIEWEDGVIKKY